MAAPAWAWGGLCSPTTRAISPLCHPHPAQPQPPPQTPHRAGTPVGFQPQNTMASMGSKGESSTLHCQCLSHCCIPGPTTPEPNPVEAAALSLKVTPIKTSQTEESARSAPSPIHFPSTATAVQHFQEYSCDLLLFISSHISALNISALACLFWGFSRTHRVGFWVQAAPPTLPAAPRSRDMVQDAPPASPSTGTHRDCATLQSLSHLQPGKLRHGMHTEGLWSLVANQCHWGQAQGWPHLAPTSFPWSCGTGDVGRCCW